MITLQRYVWGVQNWSLWQKFNDTISNAMRKMELNIYLKIKLAGHNH